MTEPARVYSSRAIANYLLDKAAPTGGLDPLQTLKLAYIAHGFTLGFYDNPLIEEDVEAWKYGPVIRAIYSMLPAGSENIKAPLSGAIAPLEGDTKFIVDTVFEKYGKLSGLLLSSLTHRSGTPWALTWQRYGQNAVIPRDLIRDHYRRVIDGGTAAIGTHGL